MTARSNSARNGSVFRDGLSYPRAETLRWTDRFLVPSEYVENLYELICKDSNLALAPVKKNIKLRTCFFNSYTLNVTVLTFPD